MTLNPTLDMMVNGSRPQIVAAVPVLAAGGFMSVTVSGGAVWTTLPAQECRQLTIAADGAKLEVRQDGIGTTGFPIFDGGYFPVFGITNANQIQVRRADQAATATPVPVRWEA